ncbi:hypothetical protein DICVIV_10245 [Dictyocaulus viviparus]|uniref:Uncharacterized protein n=1 Tax=Dictyocaulus viviparus TaxID=29172 RepID=A0A0D8XGL4_DICVI|nr:hypothetical protein DICVIV_10245 [Dictyocaulus viviparus]
MFFVLSYIFLTTTSTDSYSLYAKPLNVAQPDSNGVYVFDLTVERILTMTSYKANEWHHGTLLDYSPLTQRWSRRESNQLKGCSDNYTLNPQTKSDAQILDGVVVLDGLHKRVLAINGKTSVVYGRSGFCSTVPNPEY